MKLKMNRRGLIVTSVAGMLGITGCSAILESPEARILGIEFLNLHNTVHELKMELTESDEVVLNDQTELPSAEYNRGDLKRATTHVVRNVPDDPKEYALHAWLDTTGHASSGLATAPNRTACTFAVRHP